MWKLRSSSKSDSAKSGAGTSTTTAQHVAVAAQPAPQQVQSPASHTLPLPEGWAIHSSTQYPGRYFYLHAATQTSQWERPTGPPSASAHAQPQKKEDELMTALEQAQASGDEKALRQILEQLNVRAAAMAAGQPEPQPEAEATLQVAESAAQPATRVPSSMVTKTEAPAEAAHENVDRHHGPAKTVVSKRSKQEKARKRGSPKSRKSPGKVSLAEQERADAAAAQAAALMAMDEQPGPQPRASQIVAVDPASTAHLPQEQQSAQAALREKTVAGTASTNQPPQEQQASQAAASQPKTVVGAASTDQPPMEHQSAQVAASRETTRQLLPQKNASSNDSPVKRSVALLKAASAEDKLIKAGDKSRVAEALRLYTKVLEVIEEALASDSTSKKAKDTLRKKDKSVRLRIQLLTDAQQAFESADRAAEKAERARLVVEEEVASIRAASSDEQQGLAASELAATQTERVTVGDLAAASKTGVQLLRSNSKSSSVPIELVKSADEKHSQTDDRGSANAELDPAAQSKPLGLPPAKLAPRPNETVSLRTDAAASFATLQVGISAISTTTTAGVSPSQPSTVLVFDHVAMPGSEHERQPQMELGSEHEVERQSQPEIDVAGKVAMDPTSCGASAHTGTGFEADAASGGQDPKVGAEETEAGAPTRTRSSSVLRSTQPPFHASRETPRPWKSQFTAGQEIEVLSESLGGWQRATVTAVNREMIRVEYAGRHRFIDMQLDGSPGALQWRIPPPSCPTPSSPEPKKLAPSGFNSPGSLKPSSLRSPMSSMDGESAHLRIGRPKAWSLSSPGSSPMSSMDGEAAQMGGQLSPSSDIYTLEARVSSQLRVLLGSGSAMRDEAEEAVLQELGSALAVLDRAMQGVSTQVVAT